MKKSQVVTIMRVCKSGKQNDLGLIRIKTTQKVTNKKFFVQKMENIS